MAPSPLMAAEERSTALVLEAKVVPLVKTLVPQMMWEADSVLVPEMALVPQMMCRSLTLVVPQMMWEADIMLFVLMVTTPGMVMIQAPPACTAAPPP